MREEILGTAVFLDVRNFTLNLNKHFSDESYIALIENIYQKGIELGLSFTTQDEFYINTTGDGFLAIFLGDDNYIDGYFYSLLLHHCLSKVFIEHFKNDCGMGDYYFGIGLESGIMKNVIADSSGKIINTYLGNVINVAARLEALTKEHARAPIIFGEHINELLVKKLFGLSYSEKMNLAMKATNTEKAQLIHQEMTLLNSRLLSSYLFEHRLKGVLHPIHVFRISPTLFELNGNHFNDLLQFLSDDIKSKVLKIVEAYL